MGYNGSDKHKIALFEGKQDKLIAGDNITLTPQQDGTVRIDAEGGGGTGTVTDVLVDGVSVVNQDGEAEITMPSEFDGATSQQAGSAGLVPAPSVADKDKVLKGDGTWGEAGGGNVDDVQMNGQSIVDANKVASFRNYVELTQAEYDALPASKLTDGILYCIKDSGVVEGNQFAPVIYSLEEREIGTWTDGRPLYQKTLQFTLDSTTIGNYVSFNHGINDINQIVGVDSFVTNDDGTYYDSVRFSSYDSGSSSVNAWYSASLVAVAKTSIGYQIGRYMPESYTKLIVTLKYTKTTDVPGSGLWGTDGVPMVHYDENEKVIGTWFGETLYERTIYYDNASGITTTLQDDYEIATISNIVLRSAKGTMVNSTNGHSYALPYSVGSKGITIVYKSNSSLCLRSVGDTWGNGWKFYVIIRYTKMS